MAIRRIGLLLIATCVLLSSFSGCALLNATKQNPGYSTVVPIYTDDKQLEIMAYWSPPINEQQYTWLKECGITAVVV